MRLMPSLLAGYFAPDCFGDRRIGLVQMGSHDSPRVLFGKRCIATRYLAADLNIPVAGMHEDPRSGSLGPRRRHHPVCPWLGESYYNPSPQASHEPWCQTPDGA